MQRSARLTYCPVCRCLAVLAALAALLAAPAWAQSPARDQWSVQETAVLKAMQLKEAGARPADPSNAYEQRTEAAVFGLTDQRMGEVPVAAVALRPGHQASEDELIAFCRERLSDYKCPRRITFVAELPRTGSGKVQKEPLRGMFG